MSNKSFAKIKDGSMKIQCDICTKATASLFCSADEAALCAACDRRVHHANSNHQRLALLPPKQYSLCDICKEPRAFLFCLQDRAILCRDCDVNSHKLNQHTQKHDRFVLTGDELSFTETSLYNISSNTSPSTHVSEKTSDSISAFPNPSPVVKTLISEYFIEMLPGWHVEDFLAPPSYGICNAGEENLMVRFRDGEVEKDASWFHIPQEMDGRRDGIDGGGHRDDGEC